MPTSEGGEHAEKAVEEDPESPGRTSSSGEGEGSSSEGVLVEHPHNHDQDSRFLQGDHDSGVLVNIDGTTRDGDHESDGGREDTFVDAPEELGFSDARSSLVLVDIAHSNEISRLKETVEECLKYKEEREVYDREISLMLHEKNQEIDDLNMKIAENSLSHDVIASYLNSQQGIQIEYMKQATDAFIQRLLSLTGTLALDDEDDGKEQMDGFSLSEGRISKLVERYSQLLAETYHLGQYLSTNFSLENHSQLNIIFDAARQELFDGRNKEGYFLQTVNGLKYEKDLLSEHLNRVNSELEEAKAEVDRTRALQEQAEGRFLTVKEKLGIAVTKGKSLVQQRDALKQLLNEKTVELETTQARVQELSKMEETISSLEGLLSLKDKVLAEVEASLSQVEYPTEEPSLEEVNVLTKIGWLVDQRSVAVREIDSIKGAISAVNLPDTLSSSDLESKLNWIISSFTESKENVGKLQDELSGFLASIASYESKLLEAKEHNDNLNASITSLQDLGSKYEDMGEKFSRVSSEKDRLMKVLLDISEIPQEQSSRTLDALIEDLHGKVNGWKLSTREFSLHLDNFQVMQQSLVLEEQETALYRMILEEENFEISEKLEQAQEQLRSKSEEKDVLQKEFERVEERCSLLREKLSLAVKKGKGLVQDKEGLKISLEEKVSEIRTLKHDLHELKEQIKQLEREITSSMEEGEKMKQSLKESNNSFHEVIDAIDSICVPFDLSSESPSVKLKRVSEYILEIESMRDSMSQELERVKSETLALTAKLADSQSTIGNLEKNVLSTMEEKENELNTVRNNLDNVTEKLTQSYVAIRNLEGNISKLEQEKKEIEEQSEQEIISLSTKLAACQEELSSQIRVLEVLIKEDGFKKMAENLKGLGILIQKIDENFSSSESKELDSEKNPHLQRLLSIPSFEDYRQEKPATINKNFNTDVETASFLIKNHMERFRDFSLYVDEHITLLTQALEAIHSDFQGVLELREKSKAFSETLFNELDGGTKILSSPEKMAFILDSVSKLRALINSVNCEKDAIQAKYSIISQNLEDRNADLAGLSSALVNIILKLDGSRLLDGEKYVETEGLVQCLDHLVTTNLQNSESLKSRVQELEAVVRVLQNSMNRNVEEKNADVAALELALERVVVKMGGYELLENKKDSKELVQFLDHSVTTTLQDSDSLKSRVQELEAAIRVLQDSVNVDVAALERVAMKMGGHEFLESKKDSKELVQFLDHSVTTAIQDSDSLKSRVQELEGAIRVLQDSMNADVAVLESALEKVIVKMGGHGFLESQKDSKELLQYLDHLVTTSLQDSDSLKSRVQELEAAIRVLQDSMNADVAALVLKMGGHELLESKKDSKELVQYLDHLVTTSLQDADSLKSRVQELGAKLQDSESAIKVLQDSINQNVEDRNADTAALNSALERVILNFGGHESLESKKDSQELVEYLDHLVTASLQDSDNLKSRVQELGAELQDSEAAIRVLQDSINQNVEDRNADLASLASSLERIIVNLGGREFLESKKDSKGLAQLLEHLVTASVQNSEGLKSRVQELGVKLQETLALNNELASSIRVLQESSKDRLSSPEVSTERSVSEGSSVVTSSEILEIDDGGHIGKKMVSARTTRKPSSDHLAINVDLESERLISPPEIDDKGHKFKSLNASGLIPKEGKHLADRIDGIWVAAGGLLMGRPEARMGLITYVLVLHMWAILATIL